LAASTEQPPLPNGEVAAYESWTATLLGQPVPADPIGKSLTGSISALHDAAVTAGSGSSDASALQRLEEDKIKGFTLLQTAISGLEQLGVLNPSTTPPSSPVTTAP
jgi:hypothetical protein